MISILFGFYFDIKKLILTKINFTKCFWRNDFVSFLTNKLVIIQKLNVRMKI